MKLRALIFALILTLPEIVAAVKYGGGSRNIFTDWDEPLYFGLAYSVGSADWSEILPTRERPVPEAFAGHLGLLMPHVLTDIVLGRAASSAGISVTGLAVGLDLMVCFLSYLAFTALFSLVAKSRFAAELAAFGGLCFPWILSPGIYFHLPLTWIPNLVSLPITGYVTLPVLRGLYTQCSYPLFAVALYYSLRAAGWNFGLTAGTGRERGFSAAAGIVSGVLIYIYFFAWVSAVALHGLFLLPKLLRPSTAGSRLRSIGSFLLPHLLIVAPGLIAHFSFPRKSDYLVLPPEAFRYWFLSGETLILACAVWVMLWCGRKNSELRRPLVVMSCALAAEIILCNVQRFLGMLLTPYHFPIFYFHPLLSACAVILIFQRASSVKPMMRNAAAAAVVLCGLMPKLYAAALELRENPEAREFSELNLFLKSGTTKRDLISALLHARQGEGWRCLKYIEWEAIVALSERKILTANNLEANPVEMLHAASYMLWWYYDSPHTACSCSATPPQLPGDLPLGVATYLELHRSETCQSKREADATFDVCKMYAAAPVTHVVWNTEHVKAKSQVLLKYAKPVWVSSGGRYEVWQVDRRLFEASCS